MSIKKRIWVFQFIIVLVVITMAATTLIGVRATDYYLNRIQLARQNLEAAMLLAVNANRFSEQIAELLMIGEPERSEFEEARAETNAAISELRRIAREEIALVQSPEETRREQGQFDRLVEIRRLFREIDRAVERVLLLAQQGQEAEAIAVFRSEIENRLDAEFEKLIAAAVADERADATAADSESRRVSGMLVIGTLTLLGSLVALSLASGYLFSLSLGVPLSALADGALAIERGNLDHRIAYRNRDELGLVAARFNAMVEELQRQRQALIDARSHLESQVSERTRELGEANRKLTEVDRQRVQFLADVSHELTTPLTVLRGEAELALRGSSKPEAAYRSALANVVAQAIDMGHLVDDLLFLARSEAEELRYDFRPIPLPELVAEAVQEASVLARDREIQTTIDLADTRLMVRADVRRLKQAILIVLDNALKYSRSDSRVGVGVRNIAGHAEIRVRNDGNAIPPEELPHVFDRFYRGANASRTGGGSGLGLAIARWIVEKHNGSIQLSSSPGDGTEVQIHLPPMSPG